MKTVWTLLTPVLALLLFVSGCSVHRPQTIELPTPVPDAYNEQTGMSVSEKPIGRWWETFSDPWLNKLMDEAFSRNLDLAEAYARLDQFQAITRSTASGQRPYLNVEGQAGRGKQQGFFGESTGNNYSLSLAAGYELDLWKKNKSATRAAKLDVEASQEDIKALYISLSAQLVDLYYLAVEQRTQIDLTDSTVASFTDTLERVERRYREGLVPALDVYQARQNLMSARAGRPVFESTLAVTEHALAVLLGQYPDRDTAGSVAEIPDTPAAFPAGIPSELLTRRPDVRAEFLRLTAADARIAAAVADRFPSFNLIGSYGKSSTAFSTGNISGMFWNALVNLAQPLLDGGRRRAEVARSQAVFRANLARYHRTVLTAFQEVEDALVRNRTTEERIARLEEQVKATGASQRLSKDRYLLGLSDYLPVLTAQGLHFSAESQLLAARRQLISDRISLARALGGDWIEKAIEDRSALDGKKRKEPAKGNVISLHRE